MFQFKQSIKSEPSIHLIKHNQFLKSSIVKQYLDNHINTVSASRPKTINCYTENKQNRRIISTSLLNRNSTSSLKPKFNEDNLQNDVDEEYPSTILQPIDSQDYFKKQLIYKQKQQIDKHDTFNQKERKRSMSMGLIIQNSKTFNHLCFTNSQENSPQIQPCNDDQQKTFINKFKRVLLSNKRVRSLSNQSSYKQDQIFSDLSSNLSQQTNYKKEENKQADRINNQFLNRSNINEFMSNQKQYFQNSILKQKINKLFPSQKSSIKKENTTDDAFKYYQINNSIKKNNYVSKEQCQQYSVLQNICYPTQPYLGKIKIVNRNQLLVKNTQIQI